MKKSLLLFAALCSCLIGSASPDTLSTDSASSESIEKMITYQYGTIPLGNGLGKITVPKGFKYIDAKQAEFVLVDLWGNPKYDGMTLGMIIPENSGVLDSGSFAFNIEYSEIGFVKDDDADEIDYDELLAGMQEEVVAENAERQKQGYETYQLIGWASKPFYDKENKILHWAKEVKFGDSPTNTLNYNIRILGRKGVLVLNAIATMDEKDLVLANIGQVLNIVEFEKGFKYSDFDPEVDEVAAWTIGGLVAGKILAKAGFFVVLLKFWKVIVFGLIAVFGMFRERILNLFRRGRKEETAPEAMSEEEVTPVPVLAEAEIPANPTADPGENS